MNPRYISHLELGGLYINMGPDICELLDDVIRYGNSKIPVIKFLRSRLGINLAQGKTLYEERYKFLSRENNPCGW